MHNQSKINLDNAEYVRVKFGPNGEVYAELPSPTNPDVLRWQRMNAEDMSARDMYLGSTPGKNSPVGMEVQERMRLEGTLTGEGTNAMVLGADGKWYPIGETDMGHIQAGVSYWNTEGRYFGPRAPEVRDFMTNPGNYELEYFSFNRSNGAKMGERYSLPATEAEKAQFIGANPPKKD